MMLEQIQNAPDHFAVFGLPRRYAIDPAQLEQTYLELARLTHPDLVAGGSDDPEAQILAMELSARVNDAHRVLADDEERANYLLDLLGGPRKDQDKSLPEGFLPLIMITREELAEAQLEGDEGRIAAIEEDARAQRAARLKEIADLFAVPDPSAETLRKIRLELNALRYFQRLLEQSRPGNNPPL